MIVLVCRNQSKTIISPRVFVTYITSEAVKDPRERKPLPEDPVLRMVGGVTEIAGSGRDANKSRGLSKGTMKLFDFTSFTNMISCVEADTMIII